MNEASQTPRLTALIEQVLSVLPVQQKGPAKGHVDLKPLAAYLEKNPAQVYEWIKGKVLPNGEVALAMLDFLKENQPKENLADRKKAPKRRNVPTSGR